MNELTCAVSIATHNRLPELRRTLGVVAALDPPPDELLLCADGCDDGTVEYVRENFPNAKFIVHEKSHGSIRSRIELIRASASDIVISLDDDSYPCDPDFVGRVRNLFANHPEVAVASFPQRTDEFPETLDISDFGPSLYVGNYINAAAAFRRSAYMELEGWPADFEHLYDETDYSIQCLSAGYAVYHDTGAVIRHHFSRLKRNEVHNHHRHARNEQWCVWRRCPFPGVLAVSAYRALSQLNYARKRGLGWLLREPRWWWMALRGLPATLRNRKPAPARIYWAWLRLTRRPVASLEEWQAEFGRER
jgi:GT2 family glycosyltransferase